MLIHDGSRTGVGPPEWEPWVAIVDETRREAASPEWEIVPVVVDVRPPGAPLLAGAAVPVDGGRILRFLRHLLEATPRPGAVCFANIATLLEDDAAVALFAASVHNDRQSIESIAEARGVESEPLEAVASLLPVPFLQACHRRLASRLDEAWRQGYCPLCGSWPAFAEVVEVQRSHRFRCSRCGAAWEAPLLACAFCATTAHEDLVRLVPAKHPRNGVVEACTRCSRYVKTFSALQPCAPLDAMVDDLATVDLDFAALDHGYSRPAGAGYPLDLKVTAK